MFCGFKLNLTNFRHDLRINEYNRDSSYLENARARREKILIQIFKKNCAKMKVTEIADVFFLVSLVFLFCIFQLNFSRLF